MIATICMPHAIPWYHHIIESSYIAIEVSYSPSPIYIIGSMFNHNASKTSSYKPIIDTYIRQIAHYL